MGKASLRQKQCWEWVEGLGGGWDRQHTGTVSGEWVESLGGGWDRDSTQGQCLATRETAGEDGVGIGNSMTTRGSTRRFGVQKSPHILTRFF